MSQDTSTKTPTFCEDTALAVCEALMNGHTLVDIEQCDGMPSRSTLFRWLKQVPQFERDYARARELQAEFYADEMVRLSRAAREATLKERGQDKVDPGRVQALKLQVDALKWLMAHRAPKKFGHKVELEHSGDVSLSVVERLERARERVQR